MTLRKKRVLSVSSLALVTAAAAAIIIDAARAQTVPVRYGTDPGYASEAPQRLSFAGEDAPEPVGEIEHTVRPGETVYALGRIYDVKPGAIIEKNGLRAPYGLSIGQLVLIPAQPERPLQPRARTVSAPQRLGAVPRTAQPRMAYAQDSSHIVRQGDTLYNISKRYGVTVDELARANNIRQPYTISLNQRLAIPGQTALEAAPLRREPVIAAPARPVDREALSAKVVRETMRPEPSAGFATGSPFAWPVRGPVLADFGDKQPGGTRSDGINIAAPIGAPVRAAADGEVVYRGDELDGYGNLLLVKHEDGWVSAYAHTDAILVRKGDYVRQGQVIAKVGRSGNVDRPQLHFQLRKNLQPQDPIVAMQGELDGAVLSATRLER
jgi:murein DD-endopeptidase MepM/ murein hydrolase activator NlpD